VIGGNGNRWHPSGVNRWLRDLGIFGQRSYEKRIPDAAFRLNNEQVALLLRHLWATDGAIQARPEGTRGSHAVFFSTDGKGLADDVAALLLRLEIVARVREVHQGKTRPVFTVHVSGARDQRLFLECVGAFGPKVKSAVSLARALRGRKIGSDADALPIEVFDHVMATMATRGVTHREMAVLRGASHGSSAHFEFSSSAPVAAEHAGLLDEDDPGSRATGDLFWDRILEAAPDGDEDVFDLTVPGPASWIAGPGLVSHNSGAIEQDADIVMFIHRDDLSEEAEKRNVAELIVAKHRNGPTGSIKLQFNPNLTQFRNYAPGP
jgi:replicative DNA helicase